MVQESFLLIFFYEQTTQALVEAVRQFKSLEDKFDPYLIRKNAERFNKERFKREFREFVERVSGMKRLQIHL
jgi:hypothetical protein